MKKKDISLVISGEAGQGIITIESILLLLLKRTGYNVFSCKEYMSRVRGGNNTTEIRFSSEDFAFLNRIDILVSLNKNAMIRLTERISADTIILSDKGFTYKNCRIIELPLSELAGKLKSNIYTNSIICGALSKILGLKLELLEEIVDKKFASKSEDIRKKNILALQKGFESVGILSDFKLKTIFSVKKDILLSGSEAVALGAIAGGCNFVSSYPMSPATGALTFIAKNADKFDIIVEQAEDEISAVNMAIGAWYAGGSAFVTTSGGGFALMEEGVSLAAMIESPCVIHIGQRPGPATGLPTRTEQGDLELVLYSGHGEFPRIILAPGDHIEAFYLTQKAFYLADKYQVPVFILTDQYLLDSYRNVKSLDFKDMPKKYFIQTNNSYQRYRLTDDGISPRGIPDYGDGFIRVDSDEHNEDGHITEDMNVRTKMVEKRMKKFQAIIKEIEKPEITNSSDYKILVIGWGSTKNIIKEAIKETKRSDIAFLHFKYIYPLHLGILDYINKAKKVIIIENNATSQFASLIRKEIGFNVDEKILKFNGLPFSVEELTEKLKEV